MDISIQRVLGLLCSRFGQPIADDATLDEKKMATKISVFIHAYLDGTVSESEEISVDGSDSAPDSPYISDEEYDDEEDDGKPQLPEPTTEEEKKLCEGWVKFSKRLASPAEMEQADAFYRSGKQSVSNPLGTISRKTVEHRHRFLSTGHDWKKLAEFHKSQEAKIARRLGYKLLREATAKDAINKIRNGKAIRRRDLVMIATRINAKEKWVKNFAGSSRWLNGLTLRHSLRIKRVTKFVGKKKFMEQDQTEQECDQFVDMMKKEIAGFPPEAIINMDQTGVNRELMVSRYLALPEERQVIRMKISANGDRESVTAMPMLRADGTLHETLFLQFKEASGHFPTTRGHFKAKNVVAIADKTSIMSYKTFEQCLKEYVAPAIAHLPEVIFVLDSWKPFLNHDFIKSHLPSTCKVRIFNIPGGGTSRIQPADVGLFRQHKVLLKTIHDHVRNFDLDFNIQARDGIIMTLSLIHRSLTHPRFQAYLLYAWFKSGYHTNRPPPFENPTDVIFPPRVQLPCSVSGCTEPVAFVFCVFCDQFFCALCFFKEYHWC